MVGSRLVKPCCWSVCALAPVCRCHSVGGSCEIGDRGLPRPRRVRALAGLQLESWSWMGLGAGTEKPCSG